MIEIKNLTLQRGLKVLLDQAALSLAPGRRVGLIGKNGSGKSSLFALLKGEITADKGDVSIPKHWKTAAVAQETPALDISALDYVLQGDGELQLFQTALHEAEAKNDGMKQAEYHAKLEEIDAYSAPARAARLLSGLGFSQEEHGRPVKSFSGGWRMRIELAKLLLARHDVLLLDEPTNHLDIESIRWLEQFLSRNADAVILVSHDRAFINNVTNRTLEISCGKVVDYRVKYDEYVELRAERRESQLRAYENQQKEIADIKDFIERFRYKPTKSVQVQSRIKQLEKIVPIEIDEVDTARLHLKFPPCSRSGDYPVICDEVEKHYGDHQVFDHVNLTIKRGEKVAFVGKNGEGKSTLVKCIMSQIDHGGELKLGHNVEIGYYAQNQAQLLDDELTVFDTIDRVAKGDIRLKIRDILGAFMFGGEASDKKVKVLSGGERSRLAMIKLLLEPVNFLILDEPTNHLDMQTKDVLKEAILAFEGTVIVVSHDREFLDGLVSKVYEFGGGKVREHLGGIYDYLRTKAVDDVETAASLAGNRNASTISGASSTSVAEGPSEGALSYAEQKEAAKQRRKLEQAVKEAEAKIEQLETEIAALEEQLSTPEGAADTQLFTQHGELRKQLSEAEEQWNAAVEALG